MNIVNPFVSVVITTFRRPEEFKRAVSSVYAQSYQTIELIVIEDGDESEVKGYLSEFFNKIPTTYFCLGSNQGLAAARNAGVRVAKGELIAFLDDDDYWDEEKLQLQVTEYLCSGTDVVQAQVAILDTNQKVQTYLSPKNIGQLWESIGKVGIGTLSSVWLIRTDLVKEVGGFDTGLISSIDHDFWMKLAKQGASSSTVHKPLTFVISKEQRHSMMTDQARRIQGVKQFCEKWRPFFVSEWGAYRGNTFINKYFQRVVIHFARQQFNSGNYAVCAKALKEAAAVGGISFFYARSLLRQMLPAIVRKTLKI